MNYHPRKLISVIIPFYNDEAYIDEAVESILAQTYKEVEIIIVNDGSTDEKSVKKLKHYQKPKTTILHKENGHLASARNYGIRYTQSDYVLPLDADDKLENTFIEKAKNVLDHQQHIAAVSSYVELFDHVNHTVVKHLGGGAENFVVINNAVSCALIRKRVWEEVSGYNEAMKEGFEDWDFWLAVTKRGWKIAIIPEPLFKYRQKSTSMLQGSQKKRPELVRQLVERHTDVFSEHLVQAIYERERLILSLKQNIVQIHQSRRYQLGSLLLSPFAFVKKTVIKILNYRNYKTI